jgi:hypothetical protein
METGEDVAKDMVENHRQLEEASKEEITNQTRDK